jgi:hypothetical protein
LIERLNQKINDLANEVIDFAALLKIKEEQPDILNPAHMNQICV